MKFTLTIPRKDHQAARKQLLESVAKTTTIKGFRQGKAPLDAVEASLDQTKLTEGVIEQVFPKSLSQYLEEHKLQPIGSPEVAIKKLEAGADWEFEVEIAEKPEVDLGKYRDEIKTLKAKSAIWVPGKTEEVTDKPEEEQTKRLNAILELLLKTATVEVPQLMVNQEVNHRLSALVKQISDLGLTVEDYLKSQNTTQEKLRQEYTQHIETNYKLDFIIDAIAVDMKITTSDVEVDQEIEHVKDDQQKQSLKNSPTQKEYIRYGLTRQKVIDALLSL